MVRSNGNLDREGPTMVWMQDSLLSGLIETNSLNNSAMFVNHIVVLIKEARDEKSSKRCRHNLHHIGYIEAKVMPSSLSESR